jgi:predicted acylesterase/phospholipase RssA
MRAQNVGMSTLFRTYRVRANQEFNCQIWEAIRATTASPLLYEPIAIGKDWSKQQFINAELGANNPISYMIEEKQKVWLRQGNWPPPEIGCIVSIGSGKEKLISMPTEQQSGVVGTITGMLRITKSPAEMREKQLYEVMVRIAKDCEKKHQQIKESFGRDEERVYFRFNIEHGMQDIEETDYGEDKTRPMFTFARE